MAAWGQLESRHVHGDRYWPLDQTSPHQGHHQSHLIRAILGVHGANEEASEETEQSLAGTLTGNEFLCQAQEWVPDEQGIDQVQTEHGRGRQTLEIIKWHLIVQQAAKGGESDPAQRPFEEVRNQCDQWAKQADPDWGVQRSITWWRRPRWNKKE